MNTAVEKCGAEKWTQAAFLLGLVTIRPRPGVRNAVPEASRREKAGRQGMRCRARKTPDSLPEGLEALRTAFPTPFYMFTNLLSKLKRIAISRGAVMG